MIILKFAAVVICFFSFALEAFAGDLPDTTKTPGVISSKLTQKLLCSKSFRTTSARAVSASVKKQAYAAYGQVPNKGDCPCEVDHLISLEIGGQQRRP